MNRYKKNIFILISGLIIFSGCSISESSKKVENIPEKISESVIDVSTSMVSEIKEVINDVPEEDSSLKKLVKQEQKNFLEKNGELDLKIFLETSEKIVVDVIVKNPDMKNIQSVQAWFLYPKSILKGEKITLKSKKIFPLVAPNEQNFDTENGIVKIGVSVNGKAKKTDTEIFLARIEFLKISKSPFQLNFFTGHKKVMIFTKNGLRNILK